MYFNAFLHCLLWQHQAVTFGCVCFLQMKFDKMSVNASDFCTAKIYLFKCVYINCNDVHAQTCNMHLESCV